MKQKFRPDEIKNLTKRIKNPPKRRENVPGDKNSASKLGKVRPKTSKKQSFFDRNFLVFRQIWHQKSQYFYIFS